MKIQEFDHSIDLSESLLWRHNSAENLKKLIENKQIALNELNQDFWDDWCTNVFNLETANKFGLLVWSIILNIPLTIEKKEEGDPNTNFGFGSFRKNFNNGNFSPSLDNHNLTEDQARLVLKLRYYQLVTRATVPECNKIVKEIFSDLGNVYVLDGLNMTMKYFFAFELPSKIRQVLDNYDLLPRPSGVRLTYEQNPNGAFGFGSFRKNFNNGNFR